MFNFAFTMKKNLLFLILITLAGGLFGAAQHVTPSTLSPDTKISLLTASPGPALYSVFGHSALWVYDPIHGIDEVYNWGTFDFDTPNFYPQFIRGRLLYMLTVTSLNGFLYSYMIEGRSVDEQALNLTQTEKQAIYDFLQINRRPENIHYLYDFFYDNCATRIRDLVAQHLDVAWGPDPHPHEARSFRQMLKPYVKHIPWISFGIDILLGLPADKKASPWHYMFLPDEMAIAFQQARHSDGRMLVNDYNVLLPRSYETGKPFPITPEMVFWGVLLLGSLSLVKLSIAKIVDKLFFSLLGIAGILLFFLGVVSDHAATSHNLNLIWALPTHIYFIYRAKAIAEKNALKQPVTSKITRLPMLYFRMVFIAGSILIILWPFNPQGFHPAFFPIIVFTVIMSYKYAWEGFSSPKS